jgi:hypothetical protein
MERAAMALLLVGGVPFLMGGGFLGLGWVVGCVLLWTSPRWRWTDKLLGTLVWPGGLAAVAFLVLGELAGDDEVCNLSCVSVSRSGLSPTEILILGVVGVVCQVAVTVRLMRRAGR